MHSPPDLRAQLAQLAGLDARDRWQPFEYLITSLFKRGHFRTERESRAAGPRQLDLVASRQGGTVYMVEAKWKSRPLSVDQLDGLYARLDGTPATTVGVMISPSGFTGGVIDEVVRRKNRPVVLIGPTELISVLDDPRALARTLQRRLDHFMVTGDVLVGTNDVDLTDVSLSTWGLRQPYVIDSSGARQRWIRSPGGYGEFVFTQDLEDIDWTPSPGHGVSVDLRPAIYGEGDLLELVEKLADGGWITVGATWVVEQFNACWHGLGASSFAEAVTDWRGRYQEIDHVHHTEQFAISDCLDGRVLVLSGQLAANSQRNVFHSNLCLQISGVPLDPEPFLHLADLAGDDDPLYWRPLGRRAVTTIGHRQAELKLEPVAYVVEEDPDDEPDPIWVRGIVVAHPFDGERPADVDVDEWPPGLSDSALVICSLGQWHPWTDSPESYELRAVEWTATTDFAVVRVVADWRGALRRADGSVRATR